MEITTNSDKKNNRLLRGVPLSLGHLRESLKLQKLNYEINLNNAKDICPLVDVLNLQFRGLSSLDLAWLLVNVTHLYVNNNFLENANGIESLKQLQHLDLSHNQITNIEGLKDLDKLEVLSLHHNKMANLNEDVLLSLKKLEFLALGNNLLSDKKDMLIFLRLERLGSLTLKNNPCCKEDYPSYVIAHVPNLVYLDYQRITDEEREEAVNHFRESLALVRAEDERRTAEAKCLLKKKEQEERYKMAGVYALNDDSLFNELFEGHAEMQALILQQGVSSLIDRFREQFKGICFQLFEEGLEHANQRNGELQLLENALQEAIQLANQNARQEVNNLEEKLQHLLSEAKQLFEEEVNDPNDDQEKYEEQEKNITKLREQLEESLDSALSSLLEQEVILSNQLKDVLELAERELGNLVSNFLLEASEHFEEGRRYAYAFYCRLRELTTKLVEAAVAITEQSDKKETTAEGERNEASTPRKQSEEIFEGGDTLTATLARVHDIHLEVINKREEELRSHLTSWLQLKLEEFYNIEWKRHRTRLEEIATLSDEKRRQISYFIPLDDFTI